MIIPEALRTMAGRLETFLTSHQLVKRRPSATRKKAPASAVTWPHKTPTAEELAFAGFYYKPSATNPDNVACFVCNAQLDGWDPTDNPAFEHLTHAPDCGFAINTCIRLRNGDPNRVEDNPMNDNMIEARKATFLDCWPHEGKKGWKCKVSKMVEAGWFYDPSPEYDDGTTCAYCGLSLDGWEPKDDPMVEHRKRTPDCLFFTLVDSYTAAKPPPKKRASRASKVSRASTAKASTAKSKATRKKAPASRKASTASRGTKRSLDSDEENQPPATPPQPQKRIKWTPVDLDSVLGEFSFKSLDAAPLSGLEKSMTVEEFIMHRARMAEEDLRKNTEGMVAAFEIQGARALQALEAIQCID